jgi:dolichol kinase
MVRGTSTDKLKALSPISYERFRLLLLSIIIVALLVAFLRGLTGIGEIGRFGSIPTSGAFSIVFPLLGQGIFLLFYFVGMLIGWHQVAGGTFSWLDVGEGIAIAGLGYAIAEAIVFRQKKALNRKDERARKALHVISNLFACLMIWILGIQITSYIVLLGTCSGILLMHLTMAGVNIPGIEGWIKNVGREGEKPGEGALYNALGILFAISMLRNDSLAAISVILILALGDGLATFAGTTYGRHKLPWNENKTWEGTIGFLCGAICAWIVLPIPETVLIALSAAIIESLPLRVNDNIILPSATSLLYYFFL